MPLRRDLCRLINLCPAHFPRYMTFLYGNVFPSHQLGGFSGAWLGGGKLYAIYGNYLWQLFMPTIYANYDGSWWLGIALSWLAAIIHWPIEAQDFSARLLPATL